MSFPPAVLFGERERLILVVLEHWLEETSPSDFQMTYNSWMRAFRNARTFVGNATGGLRGGSNLASWVVVGTLGYFLWIKPERELRKEQEERAALAAASDRYRYIEKRKPIPDPQETGLIYGKKQETSKSES